MERRSTTNSRRGEAQTGFSLIELIVVGAIILIAAAVATPAISLYFRNYQIKTGMQGVAGELQATRLQAIKRNVNRGVVFAVVSATEYQYFIEDNPGHGNDPSQPSFVDVNDSGRLPTGAFEGLNGRKHTLPTGVQFLATGANECAVRFDRMGRMCQPGTAGCPAITNGPNCSTFITMPDPNPTNPGGASLTIDQPLTGLRQVIRVTPGGRILPLK